MSKMKKVKIRNAVSLVLNISMVVLVAFAISWFFTEFAGNIDAGNLDIDTSKLDFGTGNMNVGGLNCLMFFTNDSNILAALCGLILVPFNIKSIRSGQNEIPKWALIVKFIGTVAVTLTLVVVVVFLGPLMGYGLMFEGCCLYLHLICPLIAIVSFCFFESGIVINRKLALAGVLPMLIYGIVYLNNVIFTDNWIDFYGFNIGGYWYITCAIFPLFTYLLALGISRIHNKTESITRDCESEEDDDIAFNRHQIPGRRFTKSWL